MSTNLLRTSFYDFHVEHGGKMVDFAGWEMPLLYTSILEEHRHCRSEAGFFDVSHMGRLRFSGRHARKFLDSVCTRQILACKLVNAVMESSATSRAVVWMMSSSIALMSQSI